MEAPMNLQQLTTFCMVLSEKSMTAAAQKLFLTQPAVSQQIRQMEEELGVELLVRGVRQIAPTPAGGVLQDYAKRILGLVQQAEIAVQTVGTEVKGPFRFGTLNSLGLHLISPIFGLFLKNNQEVSLKLRYGEGAEVLDLLEKGELDMVFLPDARKEYGSSISSLQMSKTHQIPNFPQITIIRSSSPSTRISLSGPKRVCGRHS